MPQFSVSAPKLDPAELLQRLLRGRTEPLLHVERVPAPGRRRPRRGPTGCRPRSASALAGRGIAHPWRHQVEAAELARAAPTSWCAPAPRPGKSLAYQLPVLSRLLEDPRATALYLSPTKALAADQLRSVAGLAPARHPAQRVRRRHPAGRAGVGPRARPAGLHQPRHAAPVDPAPARASGRRSCADCPLWSSTSATCTGASSARTSRR